MHINGDPLSHFPCRDHESCVPSVIKPRSLLTRDLGNPGDVQTACLLFMLLPPKLRPMRTCLKASWPPSSQSGTKKRSRDTSSPNEKPWTAAGGLLTLVHRGRVMLVLTVNRLHYLWPTWQLSPMNAWVRKSQMNPISAIVRGNKACFWGETRGNKDTGTADW